MPTSRLVHFSTCLTSTFFLIHCSNSPSPSGDDSGSGGNKPASGGATAGGTSGKGGATTGGSGGAAAASATGGSGGTGGSGATGGASPTGGRGGTGGSGGSSGASTTGGAGGSAGGAPGGAGGTGGSSAGAGGTAGSSTAGSTGMAGAGGMSTCAATDKNGKANWTPGAMSSTTRDYLRSCDVRLINNNWGAAALGCSADKNSYSVFVNQDGSFGWNFNRGDCDTAASNAKPDFPEIEFGVHPFGAGSSDATTPDFSSTTLLPAQIKNIQSASVTLNNLSIQLQQSTSWDLTFELWVSQSDPLAASPGVYAELMTFWGWQSGRYPEPPNGMGPLCNGNCDQVSAGTKTYKLEVHDDAWAGGKWRYFQFRATDGPQNSFSGKLDVKPLLDYLVNTKGYSSDFWISRFEVGSEIDDMTQGKVTVDSVTFEVNGQTRSAGKQ